MSDLATTFGERLRSMREAAGLTQADLAAAAGLHRVQIAKLEAGDGNPKWDTVAALAAALKCKTDDFLAAPARRAGKK